MPVVLPTSYLYTTLERKFHITFDSQDHGEVFKVLTPHGVVEFKPTETGLHALNLRKNPEVA